MHNAFDGCRRLAVAGALALGCVGAQAVPLMPDFAAVPTGWTTDRYEPNSFSNVGTYEGRSNVLGIGIAPAQNFTNRPAPFQSTFYNTQGRQHAISGGPGDSLGADLFIDASWEIPANGNVRTDVWGVMRNAGNAISAYQIIGFTNYGGTGRFRAYDADVGGDGWVDFLQAPVYDAWNELTLSFTGSSIEYFVNGQLAYTDATLNASETFSAVIMQAYNPGGDPAVPGWVDVAYTAHWSNSAVAAVPEPGSLALLGLSFAAVGLGRRRLKAK